MVKKSYYMIFLHGRFPKMSPTLTKSFGVLYFSVCRQVR